MAPPINKPSLRKALLLMRLASKHLGKYKGKGGQVAKKIAPDLDKLIAKLAPVVPEPAPEAAEKEEE